MPSSCSSFSALAVDLGKAASIYFLVLLETLIALALVVTMGKALWNLVFPARPFTSFPPANELIEQDHHE